MKYYDGVEMERPRYCPQCRVDFKGDKIKNDNLLETCCYNNRLVLINVSEDYDACIRNKCPDCGYEWVRFGFGNLL
jgi:hypothetical protein